MNRLTIIQRIKIIKTYYKNNDSATATYHALRGDYGLHNRPTTQAIDKIVKKFEETGVITNIVSHVALKISLLLVKWLPNTQIFRFFVFLRS